MPGMMASILRQELDSMVRVIYLLSIQNLDERIRLVKQTLNGEKWTIAGKKGKHIDVTDRSMVDIADQIHGWPLSVYKFGCAFIHLSNFHDYNEDNPFDKLDKESQADILAHLRKYHGGPSSDEPSFYDFANYFPKVFEKIKDNLECYLEDLSTNCTEELF